MTSLHEKDFEVEVCRTGTGFATIKVRAGDAAQAAMLALEQAGDHTYRETSAEYSLVNPLPERQTRRMQVVFQLLALDQGVCSPIQGAAFVVDAAGIAEFERLRGECLSLGLTQLRRGIEPQWLTAASPYTPLESPEVIVDVGGVSIIGEAKAHGWPYPGVRSQGRMSSAGLTLGVLQDAYDHDVDTLIVSQDGNAPLLFIEAARRADVELHKKTMVVHPRGRMSPEQYERWLARRGTSPRDESAQGLSDMAEARIRAMSPRERAELAEKIDSRWYSQDVCEEEMPEEEFIRQLAAKTTASTAQQPNQTSQYQRER